MKARTNHTAKKSKKINMELNMSIVNTARKLLLALGASMAFAAAAIVAADAASILPQGETQFFDDDGNPLSEGLVYFYIPSTTTPKNTWQNAAESIVNSNPVELDAAGRALIYGDGVYRMIVEDADGNTIYDAITTSTNASASAIFWGGTSGGSANTQTITATDFTGGDGETVAFVAGFTNTGGLTVDPANTAAFAVRKDLPGGPVVLTGGEVRAGNIVMLVYDATAGYFHLINQPDPFGGTPAISVAAAGTTDALGAAAPVVNVTGSGATITSLGTGPNQFKIVTFAGVNTLTYNATSLIIPGVTTISTAAGDTMGIVSDASSNVRVVWYQSAAVAMFQARMSGAQTVTGQEVVEYATEVYDIGGFYNTGTYTWTPPAGVVVIAAKGFYSSGLVATDQATFQIAKNGDPVSGVVGQWSGDAVGSVSGTTWNAFAIDLADGNDTYTVYVSTFPDANFTFASDESIYFSGYLVQSP